MPKEDRSDWVAVAPESTAEDTKEIKKPLSAFQYYQKHVGPEIKQSLGHPFSVAAFTKACHGKWNNEMDEEEKEPYYEMARKDQERYREEMREADRAAVERLERIERERESMMYDDTTERGKRTTRGGWDKKQRKKAKKEQRQKERREKKKAKGGGDEDDEDYQEDDDDEVASGSDQWDSDQESSSDEEAKKKKAPPKPRRPVSQKQQEYQEKKRQEKLDKETYIINRQQDLRKEKASQAKKRLEFLLKQSNIFSHFGSVKEDTAKYGIKTATATSTGGDENDTSKDEGPARSRRRDYKEGDDSKEEDLEEADEHQATFLTQQPSTLGFGTMRAYQLEGLNWMIRLQENGVNGILADEMGLGKTLQSISVLVYMLEYQNVTGPHLVVVPKSTLSNWMKEFKRWAPTLKPCQFHGTKQEREEIIKNQLEPAQRDEDREWNLVLTTYEICNIEKNILNKFAWSYLIIDEAHRLKNEASAFSKTIRTFETRYRLLLSGTPLQNSLHELWALLNFLVPDVFENSEQFDEWFNLDIDDNDEKNKLISQLHKILRPFMLRRLKSDAETLPPKHETILFTGMSAMQKEQYRNILLRDFNALQGGSGGSRTAILNIVMQLRKCAGHPYLFPGVEDRTLPPLGEHLVENCGKMALLDKLLKRLKERGHRVLLFTQMTKVLDIIEDYLYMRQYNYCRIDGGTSYEEREAYIDAYNAENSEKFVFLLSTRAGGLGINLQTADVVILYDSDWNPQADLQAQDRAHRIGQKRPVQVFRFVTEHTIEEKIVERAQQKLKLDAMVVQQGRLKNQDKLSRDELLAAVRFGADKIFKSKDSSITDDDIDLILDQGKQKTAEMNEKLKAAEKGDLLDFKFDGSNVQTFEGVDYSNSAQAKQDELLGILDLGKRERKEANYNEASLFQHQMASNQGPKKPKKKKDATLPRHMRLPRLEEWQMYDRDALAEIEKEEEAAFKEWPEELQKAAKEKKHEETAENEDAEETEPVVLPPLLSEERRKEKEKLLAEGFSNWSRQEYNAFWKSCQRYGRQALEKIALEVGKSEADVKTYADAFWGELGQTRISKSEYENKVKAIEKGEKKINELRKLERGTRVFVSLFDNPWEELEFVHSNSSDKMFTAEEDRYLLCWTWKYGYGQWGAIQFAIRRHPNFRFDYFLRSLPIDQLGKRCEQLMKAAEKEVEHYERQEREAAGLPAEAAEGEELAPIVLPKFHELQRRTISAKKTKSERERKGLQDKVTELEDEINALQNRLKEITSTGSRAISRSGPPAKLVSNSSETPPKDAPEIEEVQEADAVDEGHGKVPGAIGGDGEFAPFPEYDPSVAPAEWRKPFAHFCNSTRKDVKKSLDPSERKDKKKVNGILKDRWLDMSEDEKEVFRRMSDWDKKRFEHEEKIFKERSANAMENEEDEEEQEPVADDGTQALHVPKKKKRQSGGADTIAKRQRT
uniref:Chromatin-remodeling complex ATPase chain n=1 Tax=Entomoneis paludosa TaxID=265537 RepID=A0A7S2V7T2_9STRA|mmetsp:Transcript_11337/g.23217  ORF Transcript_11337/g.23217 Transcript_11337/m.23217 type:complete len:1447 (+) Transcript_11337:114-4454(+)